MARSPGASSCLVYSMTPDFFYQPDVNGSRSADRCLPGFLPFPGRAPT